MVAFVSIKSCSNILQNDQLPRWHAPESCVHRSASTEGLTGRGSDAVVPANNTSTRSLFPRSPLSLLPFFDLPLLSRFLYHISAYFPWKHIETRKTRLGVWLCVCSCRWFVGVYEIVVGKQASGNRRARCIAASADVSASGGLFR